MKLSPRKQNLLFAALILIVAGILFAMRSYQAAQTTNQSAYHAEVHIANHGTNTIETYSLAQDASYTLETPSGYTVHLEVKDGAIRFCNSPCPDHICETYGWISAENQFAVCAPAGVTVIISPAE